MDGDLAPQTAIPVYFTVTNTGELPVRNITADVLDVDGSVNAHFDYDEFLQPGESVKLEGTYTPGETVTPGNIHVRVSTPSGEEYNNENNTVSTAVGQSDMEILDVTVEDSMVKVSLQNAGYTTAENVKLTLSQGENTVEGRTLGTVDAQGKQEVSFQLDTSTLTPCESSEDYAVLTAGVTSDTEDGNWGNNNKGFAVERTFVKESADGTLGNNQELTWTYSSSGEVTVTGEIGDGNQVLAATYNHSGKMLSSVTITESGKPVKLDGKAKTIKLFWVDSQGKPLCENVVF